MRLAFWEQTLEAFGRSNCSLFNNINPAKNHWLNAGSGISGMGYQLIFGKNEVRVGLSLQSRRAEANRFVFDQLEKIQQQLRNTDLSSGSSDQNTELLRNA